MTIQQLEYVVAVDKYRHFINAAKACGITQSTLSAMIQKLENELDVIIFDRNSHPIKPTYIGEKIINQAKIILYNSKQLMEMVMDERNKSEGQIKLGIIPTVATYILPKLFKEVMDNHPNIRLNVTETQTSNITRQLHRAELDMAILATPLDEDDLLEIPIYYEEFMAYISPLDDLYKEKEINSSSMVLDNMWILQEGHCFRNQVLNFCKQNSDFKPNYEAGNIDTLVKIVDKNKGYTIIPKLHIDLLTEEQKKNIRPLVSPKIVREISIVIRKDYVRETLLNHIAEMLKSIIPENMIDERLKKFAIRL
ncbi:MAG: hydrogen peroxide-inducible genes activator [Bacteroidales bacterium]|nr:hydrogen peroxide-inducible genes activator [Bacteroidales bacterium]